MTARRSDGGRIALGSVQIVASLLVGGFWFLMGVGVAMCTDAGPNARCDSAVSLWGWTGVAVLLSMLGGAGLMIGANGERGSRRRVATTWFAALTVVALLVTASVFWSVASAPLNG